MEYVDVPSKVLEAFVSTQTGVKPWPFDDGTQDPFWRFGVRPRDYQWNLVIDIKPQYHSSHKTRAKGTYNGMDVKVGDYVASSVDGTALKIVRIDSKTNDRIHCVVEDVFRYNTFRDASGSGNGLFAVPGEAVIFEVSEEGLPVLDPLPPSGVSSVFYANIMSRFHSVENLSNFILHQPGHGFIAGQMVSADADTNSVVLTDDDHPYLIGKVSYVNSPDHFTIEPIQNILDDLNSLPGDIGDILFSNPAQPGTLTTTPGTTPVMIKLRNNSTTTVRGTVKDGSTSPTNVLEVNGVPVTVGGTGSILNASNSINAGTGQHGVVASVATAPTIAVTIPANLNTVYGEVLMRQPDGGPVPTATINGVEVSFNVTTVGVARYGARWIAADDMAKSINDAAIPNVTASTEGSSLKLSCSAGDITIVNGNPDEGGLGFAGGVSASGLAFSTVAPTGSYLRMSAIDARAININNAIGDPVSDFGLFSVENGVKAAALYIEQGIRQASTTVVSDIASRDSLPVILGDQAHVIDKGDGEWGLFLYDGSNWVLLASAETAKVDSDAYTTIINIGDTEKELGEVSDGSLVTAVTVRVIVPFNGTPSLSVGDTGDNARLLSDTDIDLSTSGTYVVNPNHIYTSDTTISSYFSAGGATTGQLEVVLTYQ